MENIYLIENHHEALGYWRNMHISNKTIIHIDSHHDLFEGPSFPWINNYLWFAIKENILKEMFWGEYEGKRIDISEFLSDTIEIDIYGCKVKTLPPLKAMVQLILHHYKEMNSIYHLAGHNCINYEVENEDSQPRNPLTSHSRQTLK